MARRGERRRLPRQRRSRETEEAIVEAAARVFVEMGLEGATTNRIADVAGVSVGSLYQYFPNKQALTTALYRRESQRLHVYFLSLVEEHGLDDIPKLVRGFVAETVRIFEAERDLYRVLFEEVPRVSGIRPSLEIDQNAIQQIQILLEAGRRRLRAPDSAIAARLLVRTYRYNTLALIAEPLESEQQREQFVDELTTMLVHYLFRDRPASEDD